MTTRQFQESSALRIFLSYFKPHRKLFFLDMCCALMIAVIDLAFPYVSRWCMYQLLPESAYRTFFAVMAVVFCAYILRSVFTLYHLLLRPHLRHPGGGGHPPGPVPPHAGAELRLL